MRRIIAALLLSLGCAQAQLPFTEGRYASGVPTLEDVVGHEPGAEITDPAEAVSYLRALKEAAPERIRVFQYAESLQGRPLVYAVIGSPEAMRDLKSIQSALARLADGRSVQGRDRERMIATLPAVTWLAYGVHGNEISSTDAGLALAYHLVAARDDQQVADILEDTLVVIDPMQNPDGRARFVSSFEAARGIEPRGDGAAAERDEPWPSGRFNQALFDLNRDWFALTQPETRGKVQAIAAWNPVVVVDAHEMGSDETYFFPPAADPYNPQLSESSREGQEIIGRANAEAFDEAGIPYFTREVFDAFYPGYGDMWPALRGAVAMTYEQASPRGLLYEGEDGETLTYRQAVRNHFLATLTTAATVAENKERFLGAYVEDRASVVEEMQDAENRYTVIDLGVRPGQVRALADRLEAQSIAVERAPDGAEFCGRSYPQGAVVIDRAQPDGRLVATLLDRNTPLPEDFIEAQEARREQGLGHELYDVTAWSLPLMDGVEASTCASAEGVRLRDWEPEDRRADLAEADFGYAVPWSDVVQARLVAAALRAGLSGDVTTEDFEQDGQTFPRGTVIFTTNANGEDLAARLGELAATYGAEVVPMQTSWVDAGPNIGSSAFSAIDAPRVAMLWGEGTSPLSAGSIRHVVERRLGLPVTPIRVLSTARADLSGFDVVLVPELYGDASRLLGDGGVGALKSFAEEGGVLVGIGSALSLFTGDGAGLLPLQRELKVSGDRRRTSSDGETTAGTELWSDEDYEQAVEGSQGYPDRVPGVLLNAEADANHILSAGYDDAVVLFRGNTIYAPLTDNQGTNVFRYEGADEILASGYLWDDVRKQLARKPYLVASRAGEGMVVGFAQDPTVRGYLGGLDLMLANAVMLAPAVTP